MEETFSLARYIMLYPLHCAVKTENVNLVNLLLRTGICVNTKDSRKRTALHLACESEHTAMEGVIDQLLWSGMEVNVQDERGRTPLHVACYKMNQKLVDALLKHGAKIGIQDKNGVTALHEACYWAKIRDVTPLITALLTNNKAERCGVTSSYPGREEIMSAVNAQTINGTSALQIACDKKNTKLVPLLLNNSANVDIKDNFGMSALHWASRTGASDIVNILVDNGADVNAKNSKGHNPLHSAFLNRFYMAPIERMQIIENLLIRGARIVHNLDPKLKLDVRANHLYYCNLDLGYYHIKYGTVDELVETLIKHIILRVTLNMFEEFKVHKLSALHEIVRNKCIKELEDMKSTVTPLGISLYKVMSHQNHIYFLSPDDLLQSEEFIRSPDVLDRFPLYGLILLTAFQELKLPSMAVQSFYSEQRQQLVQKLPDLAVEKIVTFLTRKDMRNFIRSQ